MKTVESFPSDCLFRIVSVLRPDSLVLSDRERVVCRYPLRRSAVDESRFLVCTYSTSEACRAAVAAEALEDVRAQETYRAETRRRQIARAVL